MTVLPPVSNNLSVLTIWLQLLGRQLELAWPPSGYVPAVFSTPSFRLLVPSEVKLHPVMFHSWSLGPSELHYNLAVLEFLSLGVQKSSDVNYSLSQHPTALSGNVSFGGYVFRGCLSSRSTPKYLVTTIDQSLFGRRFFPASNFQFSEPSLTIRWLLGTCGNTWRILGAISRRWDVYP